MSTPVLAYQHGIYPRSERLVQATRDLERGRTPDAAVVEAFDAERSDYLDLQRRAGLDFLSDGLLRWQDLFRPLVEATVGLEARVLVRWFNNNSFFRAPEPGGSFRTGELPAWVTENGIPEPRVASLPSPYLFSRAAQQEGDRNELLVALAREILAPAVVTLVGSGHRMIHLEEPWLPFFGIAAEDWGPLERGLEAVKDAAGDIPVVLHVYYGDAAPHAERLVRLPVDAIGIDFVETELEALPASWPTGLVAGCLDGRRSVVESPSEVAAFAKRVAERLQPETLYLTSGSELELAGPQVAPRKVDVLGEAARLLKQELG